MTLKPAEFVLQIADTGDPLERRTGTNRPVEYRLRQLLKVLLRAHGFKAVRVAPVKDVQAQAEQDRPGDEGS